MLLNFAVKNYRSIRDRQVLSLVAAEGLPHETSLSEDALGYRTLPVALLYGANASGKSNVIQAFGAMRNMVRESVRLLPEDELDAYEPFLLHNESVDADTELECEFIDHSEDHPCKYRYGFSFSRKQISQEWLYRSRINEEGVYTAEEEELFSREGDTLSINKEAFSEGEGKEEILNSNRLFLPLVSQFKSVIAPRVLGWISQSNSLTGLRTERYMRITSRLWQDTTMSTRLLSFLRGIDVSIQNLDFREEEDEIDDDLPNHIKHIKELLATIQSKHLRVFSKHHVYGSDGERKDSVEFDVPKQESQGTRKIIELLGPIFETLRTGKPLFVDELDAKLHPLLTRAIVQLFMNRELNTKGAQLIFTTHDTNQLDLSYIRRDQIWFTEKSPQEATELYSLFDFEDVKDSSDIQQEYTQGRYGGVPLIHHLIDKSCREDDTANE